MDSEDLSICFLPHTTSKIVDEEDLYRISTLGFRGEALAGIGVCARLEIVSATDSHPTAHKLIVENGRRVSLEAAQGSKGTTVTISELFHRMPARKRFLKSASVEARMCRSIFLDRALAYPEIAFRFFSGGGMKLFLPSQDSLQRVTAAYSLDPSVFEEHKVDKIFCQYNLILGRPDFHSADRKLIQIFINGRRVQHYGLMQAVDYGYTEHIPGGRHPASFVFLTIDPELVDFNIHPAKKEVRIKNLSGIHRDLVVSIRRALGKYNIHVERSDLDRTLPMSEPENPAVREPEHYAYPQPKPVEFAENSVHPKYLGQVFGLFLVAEWGDHLFLIDQHAAHERILYERFLAGDSRPQELLFPLSFEVSDDEKVTLERKSEKLTQMGIGIQKIGTNTYEVTTLPEKYQKLDEAELLAALKNPADVEQEILRTAACSLAVKEGEYLDPKAADDLIREVFRLENARCPHGRPIWHRISREELYKLVGRF